MFCACLWAWFYYIPSCNLLRAVIHFIITSCEHSLRKPLEDTVRRTSVFELGPDLVRFTAPSGERRVDLLDPEQPVGRQLKGLIARYAESGHHIVVVHPQAESSRIRLAAGNEDIPLDAIAPAWAPSVEFCTPALCVAMWLRQTQRPFIPLTTSARD